jgi:hypothetical protein
MNPFRGYESANPLLSDIELHRARVFDALSRHSDPVLREIGRQLASGTVAPHELLSEPRYVEALQRGAQPPDSQVDEPLVVDHDQGEQGGPDAPG